MEFERSMDINKRNAAFTEQKASSSDAKQKIFHFDFSENFSCFYQDAAQSTYWAQHQITLFTVALYIPGQAPKMITYVTDMNDHTKKSVSFFLDKLLEKFCQIGDHVVFWSDGPSSQFKNRYMFEYMMTLANKFRLSSLTWNFFATSHGKGAIDGVGGSLKRTVYTHIKARQGIVRTAKEFTDVIVSSGSNVEIIHIPTDDIEAFFYERIETTMENAPKRPGIQSSHYWEYSQSQNLTMENLSPSMDHYIDDSVPTSDERRKSDGKVRHLKLGDHVVVKFQGCEFVGCITNIYGDGDFDGNFLRKKRGSVFSYPLIPDVSAFGKEDITAVLDVPLMGRHETYDFFSSNYDFSRVR